MRTVKKVWFAVALLIVWQMLVPGALNAEDAKAIPAASLQPSVSADQPQAMTLSARGKCEYSEDGVTFQALEYGHILTQGSVVRTGDGARADLFFRRMGTTVRLQAGSEIKLETMSVTMRDGAPLVHTLLDLRAGRIFTVVRSAVAGSTLEIKNAAGRSVVEGSGIGRYIITADGTHVSARGSVIPLKLVGENGITILSAGQQFSRADGKMLPASPSWQVKDMVELDEIQASTEEAGAEAPARKP